MYMYICIYIYIYIYLSLYIYIYTHDEQHVLVNCPPAGEQKRKDQGVEIQRAVL